MDTIDIFRIRPDGELVWLDSTISLEEGRARISELRAMTPGEYFLFSQKTQERIHVSVNDSRNGEGADGKIRKERK